MNAKRGEYGQGLIEVAATLIIVVVTMVIMGLYFRAVVECMRDHAIGEWTCQCYGREDFKPFRAYPGDIVCMGGLMVSAWGKRRGGKILVSLEFPWLVPDDGESEEAARTTRVENENTALEAGRIFDALCAGFCITNDAAGEKIVASLKSTKNAARYDCVLPDGTITYCTIANGYVKKSASRGHALRDALRDCVNVWYPGLAGKTTAKMRAASDVELKIYEAGRLALEVESKNAAIASKKIAMVKVKNAETRAKMAGVLVKSVEARDKAIERLNSCLEAMQSVDFSVFSPDEKTALQEAVSTFARYDPRFASIIPTDETEAAPVGA